MYILSLYFGKKRILEAKTRCTVKELRSGGVEWKTGGSNRMSGNERFRNQFSRYASSGDGRPRDETDTFVSRRAVNNGGCFVKIFEMYNDRLLVTKERKV